MHVILMPVGTAGDVHPFAGLGRGLRARGHRVTLAANAHFAPVAERSGLEFAPLGTEEQYRALMADPGLWTAKGGTAALALYQNALTRAQYQLVADSYRPGETVVASGTLAFGARLASEKLGVPQVTVHLQPLMFLSHIAPPRRADVPWLHRLPGLARKVVFFAANWLSIRPTFGRPLNEFRRELELPPVTYVFAQWLPSPHGVLGLFPDWFCPPQADWPQPTHLTGFPMFDDATSATLAPDVQAFLDAGEPPVVVTFGTAMRQGAPHFASAVAALERLGRRGILLTPFHEQVPPKLPPGVAHFDYVPFSLLLSRAGALVHHGGIGTLSQALAAGVPQLVMPLSHDQPDNAARLVRLNVARELPPLQFLDPARLAEVLNELLTSESVKDACGKMAERVRGHDGIAAACDVIEKTARVRGERPA
jgi:UDP:flavonoid glycosyltransferase YjiC (YdhE family)